jgi:PIN domain nuclease of toxin-antitoxin system
VTAALEDADTEVIVSAVAVWEIAIKRSVGKLDIEDRWPQTISAFGFRELPITAEHAAAVEALPHHHRDPFDRMLVAQATVEQATLVSADGRMRAYDVPLLWD